MAFNLTSGTSGTSASSPTGTQAAQPPTSTPWLSSQAVSAVQNMPNVTPGQPIPNNYGSGASAGAVGRSNYNSYQNAVGQAAAPYAGDLANNALASANTTLQQGIAPEMYSANIDEATARQNLANALLGVGDQYANNQIGNIQQGTGLQHQLLGNEESDFMRGINVQRFGQNSQATAKGAYTGVANNFLNNDFNQQQDLGHQRFGIQGQQADNAAQYQLNRWQNDLAQNAAQRQYGGGIFDAQQRQNYGQQSLGLGQLDNAAAQNRQNYLGIQSQIAAAQGMVDPNTFGVPKSYTDPNYLRRGIG